MSASLTPSPPESNLAVRRKRTAGLYFSMSGLTVLSLGAMGWSAVGTVPPVVSVLAALGILCCVVLVLVLARPAKTVRPQATIDDALVGVPSGDAALDRRAAVTLASRLELLLLRQIREIDSLEREVEDPDLLVRLFSADHLGVQGLRLAETLAVLGGEPVHRSAREPVTVRAVVLAAISEIERYLQVMQDRMAEGVRIGNDAHGDIRHVLAELLDNATKFSDPNSDPVTVRSVRVHAGVKITIEDHGVAPTDEEIDQHNSVLEGSVDLHTVLSDGRYGLAAVSTVASRRGLKVWLTPNRMGGTDAVVVVPNQWLVTERDTSTPPPTESHPATTERRPLPLRRLSGSLADPPPPQQVPHPDQRLSVTGEIETGSGLGASSGQRGNGLARHRAQKSTHPAVSDAAPLDNGNRPVLPKRRPQKPANSSSPPVDSAPPLGINPVVVSTVRETLNAATSHDGTDRSLYE